MYHRLHGMSVYRLSDLSKRGGYRAYAVEICYPSVTFFKMFVVYVWQLELICLIPELCCLTGLTDDIRQDFRVMKVRQDLISHTYTHECRF